MSITLLALDSLLLSECDFKSDDADLLTHVTSSEWPMKFQINIFLE